MKPGIHPKYVPCKVYCKSLQEDPITEVMSTVPEMHVDICSLNHPFYTGKKKIVDSAGRVEKFMRRYGKQGEEK